MASPVIVIYDIQLILLATLLVLFLCLYATFVWKKWHMIKHSWNYPGPLNLPIIGSGYLFMTRPESTLFKRVLPGKTHVIGISPNEIGLEQQFLPEIDQNRQRSIFIYTFPDILEKIIATQKKFPRGLKLWFGTRLIYCLHEPDHVEKVLGNPKLVQKEILYMHLATIIGDGLLTAPPQKWKKHRKIIMPSFNQKVLDSFVEVFAEQSVVLTEVLSKTIGTEPDIFKIYTNCTLDIICETAMGLQLNIQKGKTDWGKTFDKLMMMTFLKIFQIWNHSSFVWSILGYDKKIKSHAKKFNDLVDLVIKQKIEVIAAKKERRPSLSFTEEAPLKRLAFLDYIMDCGQFSTLELREEVNIFLFAGTDTTAATLSFLTAVLGIHPDVQQKVYEEVIRTIGPDRAPEYRDLPNLIYTERVIKETLRLFPVGGFFLRTVTEDVDMGDFIMPKGATAFFGVVFNHRNAKYWPDPLKFDPDRFLPEEVAKRHPCAYIPFSYGPRNCIGLKYGMMNLKVIIATVVRKFKIHCRYEKIEDIKLKANLILRFKDGSKVSLTPRQ